MARTAGMMDPRIPGSEEIWVDHPHEPTPHETPADPAEDRERFEEEVKDLFLAADEAQRSGDENAVEALVGRLQAAAELAESTAGDSLLDDGAAPEAVVDQPPGEDPGVDLR
ncbi:MAG: hypothetical protein ACTH2Q_14290 [Propionibacteriaceae bacterium]